MALFFLHSLKNVQLNSALKKVLSKRVIWIDEEDDLILLRRHEQVIGEMRQNEAQLIITEAIYGLRFVG